MVLLLVSSGGRRRFDLQRTVPVMVGGSGMIVSSTGRTGLGRHVGCDDAVTYPAGMSSAGNVAEAQTERPDP